MGTQAHTQISDALVILLYVNCPTDRLVLEPCTGSWSSSSLHHLICLTAWLLLYSSKLFSTSSSFASHHTFSVFFHYLSRCLCLCRQRKKRSVIESLCCPGGDIPVHPPVGFPDWLCTSKASYSPRTYADINRSSGGYLRSRCCCD